MRYLKKDYFPAIGNIPVTELEPMHILDVIRPVEAKGRVNTAHRLANLASQVLAFAQITGRTKYNVASGLTKALRPQNADEVDQAVTRLEMLEQHRCAGKKKGVG